MGEKILIKNAYAIVTCDEQDHCYNNYDLLIDGHKIERISKNISGQDVEMIDGSSLVLYPGLVNTHHHLFQAFVRNRRDIDYPTMEVMDWIEKIYRTFKHFDEEMIYYATAVSMAGLVKHGCTTIFDHQYCYTQLSGKQLVDRQMEVSAAMGVRYHAGRGANTLPREDGGGAPNEMVETTDEFLGDCDRLIRKYHDPEPFSMRQIVVSPCQPVNCRRETYIESVKLARQKGVRLHTHLGEGENGTMIERWGKRTLSWLEELDFVGEDCWFAHCWELTDEEMVRLGQHKSGVSHCPAPQILGGFPVLNFNQMQDSNVLISLGVDGLATNDGSNLLDTIRIAYLEQAQHSKQRGGSVTPYEVLKMATRNGAATLGRKDLGSLEPGKGADLFAVDVSGLEFGGALHDPRNMLAKIGFSDKVAMTICNGRIVYKDNTLVGVDERVMALHADKIYRKLLEV